MNILITCGGGFQGLTLVKSLKKISGVNVFLCDINEENISKYFADYFIHSVPIAQSKNYIDFLYRTCEEHNIDVVFPATAFDLQLLASVKEKFLNEINCSVSICDIEFVETFLNKRKTHTFLEKNNLPVLESLDPFNTLQYPIIGKPVDGFGGKGILKIQSETELNPNIEEKEYLWNPLLSDFEEYSVDFSVNNKGVVSQQILRRRDFVTGGFACVITYPELSNDIINSNLEKLEVAFSNRKLQGLFNVQFIITNEKLYFIDVNPRIGTSAINSQLNGYSVVKHAIGLPNNVGEQFVSSKSIRFLEERHIPLVSTKGIKGIVFDLDDTLISNKRFILDRCNLLLERINNDEINKLDYELFIIGLLNEGKAPILIDELSKYLNWDKADLLENYRNCWPNELTFYDDVSSTLKQLAGCGLDIFILTDNPLKTQQKKIALFKWNQFIKKVYYTDQMDGPKPNKGCFQIIAKENDYSPNSLIMVGDNFYRDIMGGINAGYRYGFQVSRKDGMVGNYNGQLVDNKDVSRKCFQIDSLHDLIEIFNPNWG